MDSSNVSDKVTILTVTHYSPKDEYGDLAPPSKDLLDTTITSLYDKVLGAESANHILVYNYPNSRRPQEYQVEASAYEESLIELKDNLELELYKRENQGLCAALADALELIETPYVLFLEHDWKFISEVDLSAVVEEFERSSRVNYIRFNNSQNTLGRWDTIVEEDSSRELPMCKVSCYSNHPHIVRTKKYREWVKQSTPSIRHWARSLRRPPEQNGLTPYALLKRLYRKFLRRDIHVRGIDGIEYVIDSKFKSDIRKHGFEKAHQKMGTYLYGGFEDGPFITHLGR